MSATELPAGLVRLPASGELWEKVFVVAPLVLIATLEDDGTPDVAPKHMATRAGDDRFCFVCSHRHATLRNVLARGVFTVSFPRPSQILQTSMAAGGRADDSTKPTLAAVTTFAATAVEGVLVEGCYLHLECRLDRVVEDLDGDSVLVLGEIVAASAAEDAVRHADGDDADLLARSPLLAYVSPGRFSSVEETLSFPYPHDFRK